MLTLALQARNLEAQQTATAFIGTANHIQIDLKNRGKLPVGFWADSQIVLGIGSDVPPAAVGAAKVIVVMTGSTTPPIDFGAQWINNTWVLAPHARLTLAAGESLTIDITGLTLEAGYDHATVMLTVSWTNARQVVSPDRADIAPYDGRAVALATKPSPDPAQSTGGARPPLDVGWLAEAGGPMALRAASGLIAISATGAGLDPSLEQAGVSADAADAAEQKVEDAKAALDGNPTSPALQQALADAEAEADKTAAQSRSDTDIAAGQGANKFPTPPAEIINRLAFRIQNNSFAPLVAPDLTGPVPYFLISWLSVTDEHDPWRYDALCTAAQADRITCSVLGDDQADWAIEKDEGRMQWRLRPLSPQVLFARESVVVVVDNLVSTLPPYPTALYLVYRNLPGDGNGVVALEVEKVEAWPTIGRFDADTGTAPIYQGQEITLSWNCWGAPSGYDNPVSLYEEAAGAPSKLLKDNCGLVDTLKVTPTATTTYYRLSMSVPAAPADAHVKVMIGPVTASLQAASAALASGQTTTLFFRTACASRCTITPGDHVFSGADAVSGSLTVGADVYQLTAEGLSGPAVVLLAVGGAQIDSPFGAPDTGELFPGEFTGHNEDIVSIS